MQIQLVAGDLPVRPHRQRSKQIERVAKLGGANDLLSFRLGDKIVKERMIRLQRHVDGNEPKLIFFDTRLPAQSFDRATVFFWNPGSDNKVLVDDLKVEVFE